MARETCSGAFWAHQWQRCTDVAFLGHRPASTLDSSQVTDLLVFVCYVVAHVPPSHPAWRLSDAAMNTLVGIVTTLFRQKLLIACDVFVDASATSEAAGSSADAPVALRHHGSHRCRRIDPHSAWSLLERADQKRISICTLLSAVDNQPSFMFGGSSGWKWVASRVSLAIDKSLAVFRGTKQFSISLDPSTHSGVENCVCVAYMWHAGKGVIPPPPPSKSFLAAKLAFHRVSR